MDKVFKAKFRPRKVEYLVWNDNLADMKHFCGDNCIITYEGCHIDDYFHLCIKDCQKDFKEVTVSLGSYVVKLDEDCFTVYNPEQFKETFEVYK